MIMDLPYISMLRIRANAFPVKMVTSREAGDRLMCCRWCRSPKETLSHILGQCTPVKGFRNCRHHNICDAFAQKVARAGSSVRIQKETTFTTANRERYRPDLVFLVDKKAVVIDGTFRYESGMSLSQAYVENSAYYRPLLVH